MAYATLSLSISSIHHHFEPAKTRLSILPAATSSPGATLQNPSQTLESFYYHTKLSSGSLWARVMKPEETDPVVSLLSESFADSTMLEGGYMAFLRFLVRNYLIERRSLMPHTATLIGFYKENGDGDLALGGTVEVFFDRMGGSVSPPTPIPPKDSPYICNMSVNKQLRRYEALLKKLDSKL